MSFQSATDDQRFAADDVVEHGVKILGAHGVPENDARLVAESLVTADMWGHPSHGMLRLPWYAARLQTGAMRAVTETETVSSFAAVSVLDGRDGIGQVVTHQAVTAAASAANTYGVGVVAVRNSNHFGTAAYWTRILAERGCVGVLTTNGSPAMAPWGGVEKLVGANPWSIAVPGGHHGTIVLDVANTRRRTRQDLRRSRARTTASRGMGHRRIRTAHHRSASRDRRAHSAHGRAQGLRHLVHDGRALRRTHWKLVRQRRRWTLRSQPAQRVRPPGDRHRSRRHHAARAVH